MKKIIFIFAAVFILFGASCACAAEGSGASEGMYFFTGYSYGNMVCYARIDGYTVNFGNVEGDLCIMALPDGGGEPLIAAAGGPVGFVPCGDKVAYYGLNEEGEWKWQISKPGGESVELPMTIMDNLLYGDAEYLWFYSANAVNAPEVYRINHDGSGKEKIAAVTGTVIAMMYDGSIITVNFNNGEILSWSGGKSAIIYKSDEPLINVSTTGSRIWAMHDGYFGLVEDNALAFTIRGYAVRQALSGMETVTLAVPAIESGECAVYVMFDNSAEYLEYGAFPNKPWPQIEIREREFFIWGEGIDWQVYSLDDDVMSAVPYAQLRTPADG
jgi:hypothetical protein